MTCPSSHRSSLTGCQVTTGAVRRTGTLPPGLQGSGAGRKRSPRARCPLPHPGGGRCGREEGGVAEEGGGGAPGGREAGGGREEEWEGRERQGGNGGVPQTQSGKTLGKPCPLNP